MATSVDSKERLRGKGFICLTRQSDDAEGTTSSQAQLEFLKQSGFALGMIYVDAILLEGVSGSMPGKRTDLAALIKRKLEVNDFDVLLVQRLDRLTRGGSAHGFWFEQECARVGITVLYPGEDLPDGPYSNLIKVAKLEGARDQARSISQRSVQGAMFALEQNRNSPCAQTPFGCWRQYNSSEGTPLFYIRNIGDGRQEKLTIQTKAVIDTYGTVGGRGKGHYRKQKSEQVFIVPGDADEVAVIREMMELRWVRDWGGKRIADQLNRRGVLSPKGLSWGQNQVESICDNLIYFGFAVGNRGSTAIFHERSTGRPKPVDMDAAELAGSDHVSKRWRPPTEWHWRDEPLMKNFLPAALREAALSLVKERHLERWQRTQDPHRPRKSKNKHKDSEYLLTGLLHAKQDGEPMVGVLCGKVGQKVRYYRHRRGNRSYMKGGIYSRMVNAQPLERAIFELIQQVILDAPDMRQRVRSAIDHMRQPANSGPEIGELRRKRDSLLTRMQMIVRELDEATLVDIKPELLRLRLEREDLDRQIAEQEQHQQLQHIDVEAVADRVVARISQLTDEIQTLSPAARRKLMTSLVSRIEVDLESKAAEVWLTLPPWALAEGINAMRLVPNSASSTSFETHHLIALDLGLAQCVFDGSRVAGKWGARYCCHRTRKIA